MHRLPVRTAGEKNRTKAGRWRPRSTLDARPLMVKVERKNFPTKSNTGAFCVLACPPMRSSDVVAKGASTSTTSSLKFEQSAIAICTVLVKSRPATFTTILLAFVCLLLKIVVFIFLFDHVTTQVMSYAAQMRKRCVH